MIVGDKRIKATVSSLAKLSNCSRMTIYNRAAADPSQGSDSRGRGWPISALDEILKARESARLKEEVTKSASASEKSSEERLHLSRDEVLYWKDRFDSVSTQLQDATNLLKQVVAIAESARSGQAAPAFDAPLRAKVVSLLSKARRQPQP